MREFRSFPNGNIFHLGLRFRSQSLRRWAKSKLARAEKLCNESRRMFLQRSFFESALYAVNAWGTEIMDGSECCTLRGPPYCYSTEVSASCVVLGCLTATLVVLIIGTFLDSRHLQRSRKCKGAGSGLCAGAGVAAKEAPPVSRAGVSVASVAPEAPRAAAGARGFGDGTLGIAIDVAAPAPPVPPFAPSPLPPGTTANHEFEAGLACPSSAASPVGAIAVACGSGSSSPLQARQTWLREELQAQWHSSCLRVLPGSDPWGTAAVSLFVALWEVFDFQADNVRCQFEHFLSLWRSHAATVADRFIEDCEAVQEEVLLLEALLDLHCDLLEGFLRWRARLAKHTRAAGLAKPSHREHDFPQQPGGDGGGDTEAPPLPPGAGGPSLGGACWAKQLVGASQAHAQLAEISTYLLVWGEAGNLRFMPEVVYFITELALAADAPPACRGLYGSGGEGGEGRPGRSGRFLVNVMRPIYRVVFDEWSEAVEVAHDGKDKRILREGFDAFLPRDAANYDDWNELFCDPRRLCDAVKLRGDGRLLFAVPGAERFAALPSVDWASTLEPSVTKTHRELHSLWGVFATMHRIFLLHALMFTISMLVVTEPPLKPDDGSWPLLGETLEVRLAAVGILVPLHGALLSFARWHVTGLALRRRRPAGRCAALISGLRGLLWTLPLATYACVRLAETSHATGYCRRLTQLHYVASALGLYTLLFAAERPGDALWPLTKAPWRSRALRHFFWAMVLALKLTFGTSVASSVSRSTLELHLTRFDLLSAWELSQVWYSTQWISHMFELVVIWLSAFLMFFADTQLWFTLACTILGSFLSITDRRCHYGAYVSEDTVAKIPWRFSRKVLTYAYVAEDLHGSAPFSLQFPALWDRIVEYMRYEDKCDSSQQADISFRPDIGCAPSRRDLERCLHLGRKHECMERLPGHSGADLEDSSVRLRVPVPEIFRPKPLCERGVKGFCGLQDPVNQDLQWRITALGRGLALPMPRPFRAPYIPGITVLIPHYGEQILLQKSDLLPEGQVPLIDFLEYKYKDEFKHFTSRQQLRHPGQWPASSSQWREYIDSGPHNQWPKICGWASMRSQTLWRTVSGICLYHPALQALYEAQGDFSSRLARVWDPAQCFTCLVSMQQYKHFQRHQVDHTNLMLDRFPPCLKIAFIDFEDKGDTANEDNVHPRQCRRYYSCLLDRESNRTPGGNREPRLRIELPGFPMLGDGKGDNQNHALPFTRGAYTQLIDANQGSYFEQMLLLPSALGEFRSKRKKILGMPEHITSDFGSIGNFAAAAEVAFGTILQRTYTVLGARMHYGHPDIMNKEFMMQQGGVSKATKTLNLSEDIFAGMDFVLRGEGRCIQHCEYLHLAKGRDLGFNSVLQFFSKLSSGAGEQILTRQMFRLCQVLELPDCLTFWYAHVGYYLTQSLVSMGMPMLVLVWLLVLVSSCEASLAVFSPCFYGGHDHALIMARLLSTFYSLLMIFYIFITSLPIFAQTWHECGFKVALFNHLKAQLTCSWLLFIFQAKVIGYHFMHELRYGGATYITTGRGLPTHRRPFLGTLSSTRLELEKVGGLYLDYAAIAFHDGARLLLWSGLVIAVGGVSDAGTFGDHLVFMWGSVAVTIVSWLLSPFIFNPNQFELNAFRDDLRAWCLFFAGHKGEHWVRWYQKRQRRPGHRSRSLRSYMLDFSVFGWLFFFTAWFAQVNLKLHVLSMFFGRSSCYIVLHAAILMPPIFVSFLFCFLLAATGRPSTVPLLVSSVCVEAMDTCEGVFVLLSLLSLGWTKTFVSGVFLKYVLRSLVVWAVECVLRTRVSSTATPTPTSTRPLLLEGVQTWVHAHRMFRDFWTSLLILLLQFPMVLLTCTNELLCPGFSVHGLLIYRDPGHPKRAEAVVSYSDSNDFSFSATAPPQRQSAGQQPRAEQGNGSVGDAGKVDVKCDSVNKAS